MLSLDSSGQGEHCLPRAPLHAGPEGYSPPRTGAGLDGRSAIGRVFDGRPAHYSWSMSASFSWHTASHVVMAAALLLLLVPPASGQGSASTGSGVVAGTVVDAQTGLSIAGAQVRLQDLHRVEVSHDDGAFEFRNVPVGSHSLVVQRIGYRLQTQPIVVSSTPLTVRIALDPVALTLTPLVVTGSISERAGEEVLSPTSVVSGRALDRSLSGTIASTLRDQPGVTVTSVGPATGRPVIRGLGGDRIVMLEDGQRPGDLSSTSGDHAVSIDPLTASRIEVVRGPMSLLYGSSALGGVVNVIRDEVPTTLLEHPSGAISLQGSSVDAGVSGGAFATTRVGPLAIRGEGSARRNGNLQTPAGELLNTSARTYSASVGGAYVADAGYAGLAYRGYSNDYGIPGGFVGAHPGGVDIRMRRHTVRGDAERHIGIGPFERVRLSGLYTAYNHEEVTASGSVGTSFDQDLFGADLVGRHGALGPLALGAVGARVQYRDITTGGSLRTPSTFDWSAAGFIVEEIGTGALRGQVGARYDWSRYVPREATTIFVGGEFVPVRTRTFGSVSGSLGILYTATPGVRVGASLARAYRTPDFNELYSDGPHLAANSYDVGDPDLDAESGLGADLFVRVTRERVQAEVAAFRNQLDDYVFPSSRGRAELGPQGTPRFQYTNEDVVLSGAEGRIELSLTSDLIFDATASYVRGKFTSARAPIPVISNGGADTTFVPASLHPPLLPPLRGRTALRYDRPRYFLEGAVRVSGRQDRTGDFEEPTAGYGLADLSLGWRLLVGAAAHAITLRVDNLFDKEYRDHLSRTKAVMPEPGRSLGLLYRLSF